MAKCEHCWNREGRLVQIGRAMLCLCAACHVWLANLKENPADVR